MYQAPSVKRAFQILELVAKQEGRLTISDLSRELGISKSTVHGIAQALEGTGAVVRDNKTKRYSLGMTIFELGRAIYARIDLKDAARPIMEALMRSTQQTVFLGVRSGNHISIIDVAESTQDLKITAPIGSRIPLLAGAIGKVFLASMTENQAAQMIRTLELRRDTERSITDPGRYLEEVRKTRECGYALDDEEYIQGVRAVAAPIRTPGGELSAIWVVGFTSILSAEKMRRIATETRSASEAISRDVDLWSREGKRR